MATLEQRESLLAVGDVDHGLGCNRAGAGSRPRDQGSGSKELGLHGDAPISARLVVRGDRERGGKHPAPEASWSERPGDTKPALSTGPASLSSQPPAALIQRLVVIRG